MVGNKRPNKQTLSVKNLTWTSSAAWSLWSLWFYSWFSLTTTAVKEIIQNLTMASWASLPDQWARECTLTNSTWSTLQPLSKSSLRHRKGKRRGRGERKSKIAESPLNVNHSLPTEKIVQSLAEKRRQTLPAKNQNHHPAQAKRLESLRKTTFLRE